MFEKIYRPPEGEGIHPREASRHHIENSSIVLKQCLDEANIKINDLDMIAYAGGPGLGPCLRVGAVVARSLSSYYDIPIYPVNHAIGHIELGKLLTGAKKSTCTSCFRWSYHDSCIFCWTMESLR